MILLSSQCPAGSFIIAHHKDNEADLLPSDQLPSTPNFFVFLHDSLHPEVYLFVQSLINESDLAWLMNFMIFFEAAMPGM